LIRSLGKEQELHHNPAGMRRHHARERMAVFESAPEPVRMGMMRCIFRWGIDRTSTEKTSFGDASEELIPAIR
jgi:hypothetical protein